MPDSPSIRCPRCQGTDLVPNLIDFPCGAKDVGTLTCTRCATTWDAFATPTQPGPNYTQAYEDAPDLFDEEYALLVMTEDIKERAQATLTGAGGGVESWEHREMLLRKAAWLDRAAHRTELDWYRRAFNDDAVEKANTYAEAAAKELLAFDAGPGGHHVVSGFSTDSPVWEAPGGARAYARQEYFTWHKAVEAEADRAEFEPRRGADGELYDADGRAL